MSEKLPERVYYVHSDNDSTVVIALDVLVDNETIRWFDTVKERVMGVGKIIDPSHQHFVFERAAREGGGVYEFVPMTIAIYNEKVKRHVLIPRDFTDEEMLLAAFEKTRENAW